MVPVHAAPAGAHAERHGLRDRGCLRSRLCLFLLRFPWSIAIAEDAGCHGNPLQAAQAEAALPDCLHEAPG
jgi:hypothetical protein